MTDIEKRMDRFDAMVHEYLRANRKSIEYLSEKIGCSATSLWRYRTQTDAFRKMPVEILANCFRITNTSNDLIRYILGLPTGKSNEN